MILKSARLAIVLKKQTLSIIIIVVFLLSILATVYIFLSVQKDTTPDEGEAGLGLSVGEFGCRNDDDCVGQYVECDERMDHDASRQRCEYYKCPTGYTLSDDRLSCTSSDGEDLEPDTTDGMSCGEYGCSQDSDCTDENNECDERMDHDTSKQRCVLIASTCPSGYQRTTDKCDCEKIEADPVCGDGEINVTGEECEDGNPSGVDCYWSECNKTTCKCPDPVCGDGEINVSGEECEDGNPSGVDCSWSSCNQSTCRCPEEVIDNTDDDDELPETGISDISDEMLIFYISFFVSGAVLILSLIFESPIKKYQNEVVDRMDG